MTATLPHLNPFEIKHAALAEVMRVIRMSGREGFSGNTDYITPDQQTAWWKVVYPRHVRAWLFQVACPCANKHFNAFGYLYKQQDDRWTASVGMLPCARGKGYGSAIITYLALNAGQVIHAKAAKANPAAVKVHKDAYWLSMGEDADYVYFRTRDELYPQEGSDGDRPGG
jgi:hypothetical protein